MSELKNSNIQDIDTVIDDIETVIDDIETVDHTTNKDTVTDTASGACCSDHQLDGNDLEGVNGGSWLRDLFGYRCAGCGDKNKRLYECHVCGKRCCSNACGMKMEYLCKECFSSRYRWMNGCKQRYMYGGSGRYCTFRNREADRDEEIWLPW